MRHAIHQFLRFFAVAGGGVILDLALSWFLSRGGMPLWVAASAGFTVAAVFNYFLHELWTFRDAGHAQFSGRRATQYVMTCLVTLAVRLAIVATLERLIGVGYALFILLCGAGVSFFVNFAISKIFVFADRA